VTWRRRRRRRPTRTGARSWWGRGRVCDQATRGAEAERGLEQGRRRMRDRGDARRGRETRARARSPTIMAPVKARARGRVDACRSHPCRSARSPRSSSP
jgi:hypothetical protein